jgi:hypothetical protein
MATLEDQKKEYMRCNGNKPEANHNFSQSVTYTLECPRMFGLVVVICDNDATMNKVDTKARFILRNQGRKRGVHGGYKDRKHHMS